MELHFRDDGFVDVSPLIDEIEDLADELENAMKPNWFTKFLFVPSPGLKMSIVDLGNFCRQASCLTEQGKVTVDDKNALIAVLRAKEPVYCGLEGWIK